MFFKRAAPTSAEEATAGQLAEVTRSRRAIAEAYERERRRIERDLHDGAQQYFVAANMALGEARATADSPDLARAQELINEGLAALRRTVHGIHPSELREFGLVAAVRNAAAAYGEHITIRAPHALPELSPAVLAAAYFFTTEALTNAARHAPGAEVSVLLVTDKYLSISVVDGGPGGAWLRPEGGLAEMADRLAAFDATMTVHSPAGGPTQVTARIPLLLGRGESGIA